MKSFFGSIKNKSSIFFSIFFLIFCSLIFILYQNCSSGGGSNGGEKSLEPVLDVVDPLPDPLPDLGSWIQPVKNYDINLFSIVYNGSEYAALGESNSSTSDFYVLKSKDPQFWSLFKSTNLVPPFSLRNAIWINSQNQYMALGSHGLVWVSQNAYNWSRKIDFAGTTTKFDSIISNGSRVVVTGESESWHTDDGENWTKIETYITGVKTKVFWINNKFIKVSANGSVSISNDAISWNMKNSSETNLSSFNSVDDIYITWNGTNYYLLKGRILYISSDAVSWTSKQMQIPTFVGSNFLRSINKMFWINNIFVGFDFTTGDIFKSNDAIIWTAKGSIHPYHPDISSANPAANINEMIYENNQFIAVAKNSRIFISNDGVNWTLRSLAEDIKAIDWDSNTDSFYAITEEGTLLYSQDGRNWEYYVTDMYDLNDIAVFQNEVFVTTNNMYMYNKTYTVNLPHITGEVKRGNNIIYDGKNFLYNLGTEIFKIDGSNSHSLLFSYNKIIRDLFYDTSCGYWASGHEGIILYSSDGINWIEKRAPVSSNYPLYSIACKENLTVAVGYLAEVLISKDNNNWNKKDILNTSEQKTTFNKINQFNVNGKKSFYIVGNSGKIFNLYENSDGEIFAPREGTSSDFYTGLNDVIYANGRAIIVGDDGNILYKKYH